MSPHDMINDISRHKALCGDLEKRYFLVDDLIGCMYKYFHNIHQLFHLPCNFLDHLSSGLHNNGEKLHAFHS